MFFPPLEKINVIDASDYKALGDALAIVCLHRIYGKVINSELIESELTNTRVMPNALKKYVVMDIRKLHLEI
ncbi:hypothetical protein RIR_jg31562.t1 [Rhizophagus irregularis DAOM 181602=DAOM 197198]|nr:hypothetical protein RIR_jg31562.t1 [Rhizophagus irregularis DAOM 181602=DAOM 197198]